MEQAKEVIRLINKLLDGLSFEDQFEMLDEIYLLCSTKLEKMEEQMDTSDEH